MGGAGAWTHTDLEAHAHAVAEALSPLDALRLGGARSWSCNKSAHNFRHVQSKPVWAAFATFAWMHCASYIRPG